MTPRRPSACHLAILRAASLLMPSPQRTEWLAEWSAELWYVNRRATAFCLGAFRDALVLRRNYPGGHHAFALDSPVRCLLFLTTLAAAAAFLALRLHLGRAVVVRQPFLPAYLFVIPVSLLVASATTPLSLGEYPVNRHFSAGIMRMRRWLFFAVKIALLMPVVWYGSLDLAAISARAFHSHGYMLGLILAFRWALNDQRARCPVCLRRLTNPTRIGEASHTFLEWFGTELVCRRGHGLLYVPEIPTTYSTQRWQSLDPSWSNLFL